MPEATIASAVARTVCSFTLQANLFQLFQPIGGVSASPFAALLTTSCVVSASAGEERAAIVANQTNGPIAYFIHPPHNGHVGSCVSATKPRCKLPEGRFVRQLR